MMKYLAATILFMCASLSQAAELVLFDVPLHSADRATIRQAIKQAGGKLLTSSRSADRYDAGSIGLPDATHLEVVYLNDAFVLAQYTFSRNGRHDERLRKLIAAKYGAPQDGNGFGDRYISFTRKFNWSFEHDMQLVYKTGMMEERFLTYVDRAQQRKFEAVVQEKDSRDSKQQAEKLKRVF